MEPSEDNRALGAVESTTTFIEISDPSSNHVIRIEGEILTAPNGVLDLDAELRQLCLLSEGGQFLVSRSHLHNPRVSSLAARAKRLKYKVDNPIPVDMSTIRVAYEKISDKKNFVGSLANRDTSHMQRELIGLIARGAALGASDIHVAANTDGGRVRMRIDGAMRDMEEFQPAYARELLSTAYTLSDVSATQYMPGYYQNARISAKRAEMPNGVQSVRLQWNPLVGEGRLLVMRLLYTEKHDDADLDVLGYTPKQLRLIKYLRQLPTGIVIICGPTGSGKSTTLKSALVNVMKEHNYEINVITVEDPPEYIIPGAHQMPVNTAEGSDDRSEAFLEAIRAMLRSDPDVGMIGEVRDPQSAGLALEGAQTGHQIWTSLHTNHALGATDRLRHLLPHYEFLAALDPKTLTGIIGQRLIRKLCPHCKKDFDAAYRAGEVDEEFYRRVSLVREKLGRSEPLYARGPGCRHCDRGHTGRTVAAEILIPDEKFMELIRDGKKFEAREHWLTELGGSTMLAHALENMFDGVLAPADVESKVDPIIHEPFMDRLLGRGRS